MSFGTTHDATLRPDAPARIDPDSRDSRAWYRVTRYLIPAQFALVIVVLAASTLFEKWLGGGSGLVMAVLGLPALAFSSLLFLVWALVPPTRTKLRALGGGVIVVLTMPVWTTHLSHAGRSLFFATRRARMDALARDVTAYGRIDQMTDGLRYFKSVNHELVAYSPAELDSTSRGPKRRMLAQVLAQHEISPARYEEFRARLRDVKFIELEVHPGYVVFEYDGLIDNLEGYLLVRPGGAPPALGSKLLGTDLVLLEPLGGGWYRWATT